VAAGDPSDTIEIYTLNGQLASVTTRAGLTTTLAYNASGQLISVTGPFGHNLRRSWTKPTGSSA
jgi:YD repeat-containing protein